MPNLKKLTRKWLRCINGRFRPHRAMREKNQSEIQTPGPPEISDSLTDVFQHKFFVSIDKFQKRISQLKDVLPCFQNETRQLYQDKDLELQDLLQKKDAEFTEVIKLPIGNITNWKQVLESKNYHLQKQIGKGGYGVVYQVKFGSLMLACKVIDIAKYARKKRLLKHLKVEIFVLERSHHPNIITVIDHFIINNHAYIIMEYADGGSLEDQVDYYGPMSETMSHAYFVQITRGLFFLHSNNIAHRDLKLDNVLLVNSRSNDKRKSDRPKLAKLIDFGLSDAPFRKNESRIKSGNFGGTISYMAPEIIRLDLYEEFDDDTELDYNPFIADIWALGVCLFMMLTRTLPFDAIRNDVKSLYANQLNRNYRFPFFSRPSNEVKSLLKRLLEPDPSRRIDPTGIIMHPWTLKYLAKFNELDFNDGINWNFEAFLAENQKTNLLQEKNDKTEKLKSIKNKNNKSTKTQKTKKNKIETQKNDNDLIREKPETKPISIQKDEQNEGEG